MNKIGVTALALLMVLVGSIAMVSAPADAVDRDVQLSIGTVSAQEGSSVDVDITIDKNIGFFGAQIQISYDSNLTLTGATKADIMEVVCNNAYSSPYSFYIQSKNPENTTATGTVLTLTFSVPSSAPDEMPVKFQSVKMFNYDEDQIFPALNDGSVATGEVVIPVTGIAVDKTTVTMDVNQTVPLTYAIAPTNATNKNVTWSSSDNGVATVVDGVIRSVSYGTAVITVTTEDGGKTANCAVTVAVPTTPVSGVSLSKNSMTVAVGSSDTLTATVAPSDATNKNVKWSSSNSRIATVVDGTVTGVSKGNTVIIVTTVDGGFVDTCSVTVGDAPVVPVPVTGVSLDKTSVTIGAGSTATVVATVSPSDATNKGVTWSSSNNSVATVSGGVITGVSGGTATITATTIDGGKTASCTVTVSSSSVPVTGVTLRGVTTMEVGKTETFTVTVQPSDATNKGVIWNSSDASILSVSSNGAVKAVAVGTATVTVTTVDGGYTASCTVTVKEAGSSDNTVLYIGIVVAVIIVLLALLFFLKKSGRI